MSDKYLKEKEKFALIKTLFKADLSKEEENRYDNIDVYYDNDNIAKDVLRNKYLAPWESSPLDMWGRCAWAAAQAEETEEKRIEWATKFFNLLCDFKFVPGGRINYGLGRDDINVTYSNCYVVPMEDSLTGIYKCLAEEAATYKTGGGCGHDLSMLRPKGAGIKGTGGESCGPVGFMELFSISTNTVAQQNRRGANMQTLLVSHPDIEEFIEVKNDIDPQKEALRRLQDYLGSDKFPEELKIIADKLEIERHIYHSNISIKLTDKFLNAVEKDEKFDLEWGGEVYRTVSAKELWNKIVHNAWASAEPGLIFWDRMTETNNLEYKNPIVSTNPCIIGSTLIAVADGRNAVSIKQLMEEGKDVPVYSTNLETGQVEIKWGRNARKTGDNEEVWKLTLDDGSTFIATPNHKVLLENLEYKELKDLQPGESIFSFNSNAIIFSFNSNAVISNHKVVSVEFVGYEDVYNITVDDNHNYHVITSNVDDKFITSSGICVKNCSEIPLGNYGNCLLGHINLVKYCEDGVEFKFNLAQMIDDVAVAVRFLDNIITLNDGRHALPQQNETALGERRMGLGITGLGDMLVMLGMRYGDDESIQFVDRIMSAFRDAAYGASCDLAAEKCKFPWYNEEGIFKSKTIQSLPEWLQNKIVKQGLRNGMLLTCAPVGSGSIIAQTTSGIEPIFRTSYTRKVKNPDGITFTEYKIFHPLIKKLFADTNKLPNYIVDSSQITPYERVKVQATIQKYIDNSISSTVNLPESATEKDVADVYINAWKLGCKGITVYREGSRQGVLLSNDAVKKEAKIKEEPKAEEAPATLRPCVRYVAKRPMILSGETFKRKVDFTNKKPYNCYITVNFKEDTRIPCELLVTETNADKEMLDIMNMETICRLISLILRHEIPIKFLVQQLEKVQSQYIYSLPISIASILRNYMDEEEDVITDESLDLEEGDKECALAISGSSDFGFSACPICKQKTLKHDGGCACCVNPNCNYSKCS